jgi:hypothetical protein
LRLAETTVSGAFITRDTVLMDTFAILATSRIVGFMASHPFLNLKTFSRTV